MSLKYALTQYQVVLLISYEGADIMTTPPTSGEQIGCHGNTNCLAMKPRNLHFL